MVIILILSIFKPYRTRENDHWTTRFLYSKLLEDRDRFYRETSRLKSQLAGYENFESERVSYQQQLHEKEQTINKLKQQVEMLQRKIWGKSSERFINEDPSQSVSRF